MSRLCIFFSAGGVRYAVDALGVTEVAVPDADGVSLHGHEGLRDLSVLLGGTEEKRPGTVLRLDTSPGLAARVARVDGVHDALGLESLPLGRRLIPYLAPVVRSALVFQDRLVFELDVNAVVRGLTRTNRPLVFSPGRAEGSFLTFGYGTERFGVGLGAVVQLVPASSGLNAAPFGGPLAGALAFRHQLVPVFRLTSAELTCALVVVVEVGPGDWVGLAAERAEGVNVGSEGVAFVDVARTFS